MTETKKRESMRQHASRVLTRIGSPLSKTNHPEIHALNTLADTEHLYSKIRGVKCLIRIEMVERQLLADQHMTTRRKLTSDDVRRLTAAADIQFKKLAKILPDRTRVDGVIAHIKPDRDTLIAEAQALGLPLEWIFGERGATIDQPADPESD